MRRSHSLNRKVRIHLILSNRPALSCVHRALDDDMPDVADLLKTYTRQVASLNPVASTSKVLTTTTFDGSAVYFTRRPRRREGAATTALVSDALKSLPLRYDITRLPEASRGSPSEG